MCALRTSNFINMFRFNLSNSADFRKVSTKKNRKFLENLKKSRISIHIIRKTQSLTFKQFSYTKNCVIVIDNVHLIEHWQASDQQRTCWNWVWKCLWGHHRGYKLYINTYLIQTMFVKKAVQHCAEQAFLFIYNVKSLALCTANSSRALWY